jgi:micrococcal nuclease
MKRALVLVVMAALVVFAFWIVSNRGFGTATGTAPEAGTEQPVAGGGSGVVAVPADAESMVVVSIHDGDTLNLRDSTGATETVRIIGVDTPEVYPEYECFGDEATDELNRLAPVGSTLKVTTDEDPFDDYDRLLLYLWNDQGVFVNLALVENGFAEAIRVAPNDAYYDQLLAAENTAAHDGLGMWGC